MHTCIRTYMHTYIHAYTHAYMHACLYAYMHAYIHTCIGSAEAQEHVTDLLLILANDDENLVAISKAGAIKGLIQQLRGAGQTSIKAQQLAAAVLSHLSNASDENVDAIAAGGERTNGIRPLVGLLSSESSIAQVMHACMCACMHVCMYAHIYVCSCACWWAS